MAARDKRKFVYKSMLRSEFGLNAKQVEELGPPDQLVTNPHYKSGPPSQLYLLKRVRDFVRRRKRTIEKNKTLRPKRVAAARKAVQTKTAKLLAEIEQIGLKMETDRMPPIDQLIRDAQSHADCRYEGKATTVGPNGVIAYVRHNFSNYDELLAIISGRVGGQDAYDEIRFELDSEVERAIDSKYPDFDAHFEPRQPPAVEPIPKAG